MPFKAVITPEQLIQFKLESDAMVGVNREQKTKRLAEKHGISWHTMKQYVAIAEFPMDVLEKIRDGKVSMKTVTFLATTKLKNGQKSFILQEAIRKGYTRTKLRVIRDLIRKGTAIATAFAIVDGTIEEPKAPSRDAQNAWHKMLNRLVELGFEYRALLAKIVSFMPQSPLVGNEISERLFDEAWKTRHTTKETFEAVDRIVQGYVEQIKTHVQATDTTIPIIDAPAKVVEGGEVQGKEEKHGAHGSGGQGAEVLSA